MTTLTPRLHTVALACALFACCLLPAYPPAFAAAALPAAADAPAAGGLTIQILEGEGELNDVRARTAREPIVEVRDRNHKPVAGALVTFAVHGSGSQSVASFSGVESLTVRTGLDGRAIGHGFEVTQHTGPVTIEVTAVLGVATATAIIHQTNYAHGNRLVRIVSQHKLASTIVAGAAGAVAASTVLALESQNQSTTITPGTGTVTAIRRPR